MDLINESVNNSLIVEENTHPSYTGTTEVNPYVKANNKLSFGANTDVLQSPVARGGIDALLLNFNQVDSNAPDPFKVMAKSQRHTPTMASAQRIGLQSAQVSGRKNEADLKEFEDIYKKSTENLFLVPPTRNTESGFKEKFNIWKSQSNKFDLISGIP